MYKKHPIGLLLTAILMVLSCSTTKMYEGEQLPRDEVAILKPSLGGWFGHAAIIRTVDGQSPGLNDLELAVLPGERILVVQVIDTYVKVSFEAEAGRTYIVHGKAVAYEGTTVWIEDAETHEIVAEKKPKN